MYRATRPLLPLVVIIIIITILPPSSSYGQSRLDSILNKLDPQKLANSIQKKAKTLTDNLVKKSGKALDKLQAGEEKIYRKMLKGKDSLLAKSKLQEARNKYEDLRKKMKLPGSINRETVYIPKLDSLTTLMKFLDQNGVAGKFKDAISGASALQDKFQQAEKIKSFLKDRKAFLKQQVENLGLVKQFKKMSKKVYYYGEQVNEYKEMLKDPKKIEKKALALLSKTKIWKNFFKKNSVLASIFRMPSGDNPTSSSQVGFAALRTRGQVMNYVQQANGNNPRVMASIQQNLQANSSRAINLQNKIRQLIGGKGPIPEMPNFKPNSQKTKSFFKRLEFGTTIQTQKATNFFPATGDFGLSLGYKLNDKSVIGIGSSYKMGFGKGWNHIRLTNEGIGLKSFVDWKIKGSWWISGGYEQNYRTAFKSLDQLKDLSAWQQSGLVGMSKIVSMNSKLFKKTKIQLLWDFLSYQQRPRTQPLVFRFGYNF